MISRQISHIKNRFRNISIQSKFLSVMVLQSAIVLVLVSVAVITNVAIIKYRESKEELSSLTDIVALNASSALLFGDSKAAQETLNGLKVNKQILSAYIFDNQDNIFVFYRSNNTKLSKLPPSELLKEASSEDGGELFDEDIEIVKNIVVDGQTIGKVLIQSDLLLMYQQLIQFSLIIGAVFICALLLTYKLSKIFQRVVTKPVIELAQTMNMISTSSDFSLRVEKKGSDEVGSLIDGFNSMLSKIQERDESIATYNASLEDSIIKRTRELTAANLELKKTISDLDHSKKAAEDANNSKSQFLANMSHEIRTPMNGIMGMTEVLLRSGLTERQHHFATTIKNSTDSLLTIINDILDFSKIEAGKLELESNPFNLHETLNELIEIFSEQAEWKEVALIADVDSIVPYSVLGDQVRLRQILVNLVSNALKFTEQGVITIRVRNAVSLTPNQGVIRFEVSDTGIGIHPETLPLIFSRFTQADGSTTRRYGGTGLGLSIAKQLAELMGGTIGVESSLGVGSTFWFTANLALYNGKLPEPSYKLIEDDSNNLPTTGAKLLIVEDTKVNIEVSRELLKLLGHDIVTACNGLEALEMLLKEQFDLVLMDCQMPVMDGYEATRKYREWEKKHGSRHLPIIALTGNAMMEDKQLCLDAGMDDYLKKPFKLDQLRNILVKWLPHLALSGSVRNDKKPTSPSYTGTLKRLELERAPLEAIKELRRPGAPDILAKVISVYETDSPNLIIAMRECLEQNDVEGVIRAAHSLKTSSAMLGAQLLSDKCHSIEKTLRECGELQDIKAAIDVVEVMYQSVTILLQSELKAEAGC